MVSGQRRKPAELGPEHATRDAGSEGTDHPDDVPFEPLVAERQVGLANRRSPHLIVSLQEFRISREHVFDQAISVDVFPGRGVPGRTVAIEEEACRQ